MFTGSCLLGRLNIWKIKKQNNNAPTPQKKTPPKWLMFLWLKSEMITSSKDCPICIC